MLLRINIQNIQTYFLFFFCFCALEPSEAQGLWTAIKRLVKSYTEKGI